MWRVDYGDVGVKRSIRHINMADLDTKGCNPSFLICNLYTGTYRVEIDGTVFELPRAGGNLIFDSNKQILLNIRFGFVSSTFNY